jgi:hypothetical protein
MIAQGSLAALAIAEAAAAADKAGKAPPKRTTTAHADPVLAPEPR